MLKSIKNVKTKWYLILALTIILALYITITSLIFKSRISYIYSLIFTIISFGFVILLVFKGINKNKLLFDYPIYIIGFTYFVIQLIFGVVISLINHDKPIVVVLPSVIILGIYIITTLVVLASNKVINTQTTGIKNDKSVVDELLKKINELSFKTNDDEIKSILKSLYDDVLFSDPIRCEETKEIEEKIKIQIESLSLNDDKSNLINEIMQIKNQIVLRNDMLKNAK